VWLAFTSRAAVDSSLRPLRDEGYDALLNGCRAIVADLAAAGLARADAPGEAERLHAWLDGLAVHAAMRPDLHPAESLTAAIARHLDGLALEARSVDRA
jgi:hypothetical protein